MADYRKDGLDFADTSPNNNLMDHPDMAFDNQARPVHLQRHKTERSRLQGLQRTLTNASKPASKPSGLQARFQVWMINEGGRQLFFGVFIFFHVLVGVLGFLHYQRKDNLVNARRIFGLGFCKSASLPPFLISFGI